MRRAETLILTSNSIRHCLALLVGAIFLAHTAYGQTNQTDAPTPPVELPYHGFRVDDHLIEAQQRATFQPYLIKQLEIVESVGLPSDMLAFFRGTPIVIDPALRDMRGRYDKFDGQWAVRVRPVAMSEQTPIVLHEFLHAYHLRVLTMQNPDIANAYRRAKQSGIYPSEFQSAHFLDDQKEFFAVIGTIYLVQTIKQPPYDCSIPARTDPEFLAFLAKILGQHACS